MNDILDVIEKDKERRKAEAAKVESTRKMLSEWIDRTLSRRADKSWRAYVHVGSGLAEVLPQATVDIELSPLVLQIRNASDEVCAEYTLG